MEKDGRENAGFEGVTSPEPEPDNSKSPGDAKDDGKDAGSAKTPLFEDLLEELGAFGHWQRVIFVLISVADIFGAWAILLPIFTGATPKWRCGNTSFMAPNATEDEIFSNNDNCEICADDIQFEDDEFTSIVSEWSMVCERRYVSNLVKSIQMSGVILGAFVFAQLSDLIGRKKAYFTAHLFICIGGMAASFANSWQLYATLRFVVGCGFGGTMVVNSVYTVEFVGRRWRTLCGTVGFWGIGGMSLALLAFLIRPWRYLSVAISASGLLYLITWPFIPESPRWLCQRGRFAEAEIILGRIARLNKKSMPDLATLKAYVESEERSEATQRKYTYLHVFKKALYRKRILILICVWASTFIIYYEMSYNLSSLSGNRYINMFLAGFVDTGGMLAVILLNNTLGRRRTMTLFMAITCVANAAILGMWAADTKNDDAILTCALLGKAGALSGTYVVAIFTAELFPTVIRNLAMGTGSVCARIATVIAPQIVFLGSYYPIAPYIFCMVLSAVITPLCFLLPETTTEPLLDEY